MRILLFAFFALLFSSNCLSQTKTQTTILNKFITAHNKGTEKAISTFIKDTYHPDVYKRINLQEHISFYNQIVNEFGPLNYVVYKTVKTTSDRYVVHLIKQGENTNNQYIKPDDILVVKLDISKDNNRFMPHGLGLGSLTCELRKE